MWLFREALVGWTGHQRPHTVRDALRLRLGGPWHDALPHPRCSAERSHTALADLKGTIFQRGPFSTAYQIAVGLCTVSTEVSEVVVDKVHVSAVRKMQMSALIGPLDDSVVPAAASGQIEEWYRNNQVIKFGHPLPDKEPTPDQLMAMHTRAVELKLEPYADFSILTPHGRRMAKNLRHRSWIPQADGTHQPVVPGPESLMTSEACFAVWEVIKLMLARSRRRFSPRPRVLAPVSKGGGSLSRRASPTCGTRSQGTKGAPSDVVRSAHPRCSGRPPLGPRTRTSGDSFPRTRHQEKLQRLRDELACSACSWGSLASHCAGSGQQENQHQNMDQKGNGKGGGKGGKRQHPIKNKQGQFVTTRDGAQICFRFATSTDRDACSTPRPQGRAHVCQRCLQPHRNNSEACTARGASVQSSSTLVASASNSVLATPPGAGSAFVELFGEGAGVTQAVADITGRKTFNHLTSDVAEDATFSKLVENVRQERVLWFHAASPHKTFSTERPPRGWASGTVVVLCVCVPWFSQWKATKRVACVPVVVCLCVFPHCHRWEAGHQEGEPGHPCPYHEAGPVQ